MNDRPPPFFVTSVFHPTDFSEASEIAFAHALKLALAVQGELHVLHVNTDPATVDWDCFPSIHKTLEQWGEVPTGSTRRSVATTGLRARKAIGDHHDPTQSSLHYLDKHPSELIVLAANQREGRARWLNKPVSEPLARQAGEMTLFIPQQSQGFVGHTNGAVDLQRILVPIDHAPRPQKAVHTAAALAQALDCRNVVFDLLYIGADKDMPAVATTAGPGWSWNELSREGDVVEQILLIAAAHETDLIVMATQGHRGFIDALLGSTTERVLRGAGCPLLAVPTR